jgi:hypothetical protein
MARRGDQRPPSRHFPHRFRGQSLDTRLSWSWRIDQDWLVDDQHEASRTGRDWVAWHRQYEDPSSGLTWRLGVIQEQVRQALEELPSGPIRVISLCAGQGRDLIGALAGHDRRADVTARLVELDPHNTDVAHQLAQNAGLDGIEIVTGDASTTSAYEGSVPAQIILACGVFGNITDADVQNTVSNLACLAAPGATVLWTRHRHPPDHTPHIRYWFADAGFEEVSFEVFPAGAQTVGVHRLVGLPKPFQAGVKLFEFVGYDSLRHDHPATEE